MKVNLTKEEVEAISKATGILKFRILNEMVDWVTDPFFVKDLTEKAEHEYNVLRAYAGDEYPKGRCKNLVRLFELLKKGLEKEVCPE
jgi:hypothetical protein